MIADALAGKINLIITKSISRFARNTVDSLSYIRQLYDHGVEVFFEKENIRTFDSKGEVLLAIMSSLAQEESRSISENVTWGMRKRFSDGKLIMSYSRFLGYRKGEDGLPEIVESEAEIVRLIYRLYLEGRTPCWIARHLTEQGIPTAAGKKKWDSNGVTSILRNEKYKGDSLLQKSFTTDFLTKHKKKNDGELPQYYVRNSHPAIVSPEQWDRVQLEFERRRPMGKSYRSIDIFSSRIQCGDCGAFYGSKVVHSNDKYRKTVFYCNKKYQGTKCTTPTLNEQDIKNAFYAAYTDFIADREFLLHACVEVCSILQHSFDLKSELYALKDEAARFEHDSPGMITSQTFLNGMASADYTEQYLHYVAVRKMIAAIEREMQSRERRCCIIDGFMESLAKCPVVLDEWDDTVWCGLISKAVVHNDCTITFHFINGTHIKKRIEKRDDRGKRHTEN